MKSPFSDQGVVNSALNPTFSNAIKVTLFGAVFGLGLGLYKQLNNPFLTAKPLTMFLRYTTKYSGLGLVFMGTQLIIKNFTESESLPFATALFTSGAYLGVRRGQLANGIIMGIGMGVFGLLTSQFLTEEWTEHTLQKPTMLNYLKQTSDVRDKYLKHD